jgi:hypothetical protein
MKHDRQTIDDPMPVIGSQVLPEFGQRECWRQRLGRTVLSWARGGISGRDIVDLRCLKRPNAQPTTVAQANLLATARRRRRYREVHSSHAANRYKSDLSVYPDWQTSTFQRFR